MNLESSGELLDSMTPMMVMFLAKHSSDAGSLAAKACTKVEVVDD